LTYRRSSDPAIVGTKLCGCGCGESIIARNKNGPLTYKIGHAIRIMPKGDKHYNWNNGKTFHAAGYIFRSCPGHPRATKRGKYVLEHILVMEQSLGRYLFTYERVHHINGIKNDNRLENLQLETDREHKSYHANNRERDEYGKFI
jgi:hypothetical protein